MTTPERRNPSIRDRLTNGETDVSLFAEVYIFIKFRGSHFQICVADSKKGAKNSKRGANE